MPLNMQFSVSSPNGHDTKSQWEQTLNKVKKNIRSTNKEVSVTALFTNGETRSMPLKFCSLEVLSGINI